MATLRDLLLPFAKSIHAKAGALQSLRLTKDQQRRFREAISDDIKKCTNFIAPEVSRAALNKAARINVDLYSKNWHDQPRFDPGRKVFHFEHVLPVKGIREACYESPSVSEILDVLMNRLRVAWILKVEDSELTRLGYRSKRDDPDAAYREAKIELVPRGDYRSAVE